MSFEQMWTELHPVGRDSHSGGYFRAPFGAAERECFAWFADQARARGLDLEQDGNGNVVAWWRPAGAAVAGPSNPTRAVLTGSHLDSVPDGGAYDGPLGVVSGLAAVDRLRERGFTPARPIGVSVFVEEEGSRFGLACLGSRLATGALGADRARELTDRDGIGLERAMSDAGVESELGASPLLRDVGCFVELHVEQGRDLVDRSAAVGVAQGIWPHGRYRFDFRGEANHAGTTRMEDRHDPMLGFAMTVLAANKQARLRGQRATFGRVEATPNGTNAVPSRVRAWLDARAESAEHLDDLVGEIERLARERADRDGTTLEVVAESVSAEVGFDRALAGRLAHLLGDAPVVPTQAGHDAGILASAGVPTAMLFVRNPSGISHSPAEYAETADCLAGVDALTEVLAELAGEGGGTTP